LRRPQQGDRDIELRIEMLPASWRRMRYAPRPQLSIEPSITGTIFETTRNGRQPIADAHLSAEDALETAFPPRHAAT
jgi:hypothetical protein